MWKEFCQDLDIKQDIQLNTNKFQNTFNFFYRNSWQVFDVLEEEEILYSQSVSQSVKSRPASVRISSTHPLPLLVPLGWGSCWSGMGLSKCCTEINEF